MGLRQEGKLYSSDVTIGPVRLAGFEVPNCVYFGGSQRMAIHRLAGGHRILELLGPEDSDIWFSGVFTGPDAETRARGFDSLRTAGVTVQLTWRSFQYDVIFVCSERRTEILGGFHHGRTHCRTRWRGCIRQFDHSRVAGLDRHSLRNDGSPGHNGRSEFPLKIGGNQRRVDIRIGIEPCGYKFPRPSGQGSCRPNRDNRKSTADRYRRRPGEPTVCFRRNGPVERGAVSGVTCNCAGIYFPRSPVHLR